MRVRLPLSLEDWSSSSIQATGGAGGREEARGRRKWSEVAHARCEPSGSRLTGPSGAGNREDGSFSLLLEAQVDLWTR